MTFLLRIIHNASQNMVQRRRDVVKIEEEEEDLDARNDKSVERAETCALDTLCLALGLLTNLVQAVKEVKEAVRETRMCFFLSLNCLIAFVHIITDRSKTLLCTQEAWMCSAMYLFSHLQWARYPCQHLHHSRFQDRIIRILSLRRSDSESSSRGRRRILPSWPSCCSVRPSDV